jgi:hypothetical protein
MFADLLHKALALPSGGTESPIDPGSVQLRVGATVRDWIASVKPDAWFGPNQPYRPEAPKSTLPRVFDYPFGANLFYQPRSEQKGPSFEQLRNLSYNYDVLRSCIERRKQPILARELIFKVKKKPGEKKRDFRERSDNDPRVAYLTEFFKSPDREHDFQAWLWMVLEELLVTDALAIWPVRVQGQVQALKLIDGATIKPLHTTEGWRPVPPDPAYQQIVKGMPALDMTTDQLLYMPRNCRVNRFYGYPPVEQLIITTNTAINRQISQLCWYTEGNVPEALVQVPDTWTPDQIERMQTQFDGMLAGNLAAKRRITFVPGGGKVDFVREKVLTGDTDVWLSRITCAILGVSPQPFTERMNRATGEQAAATETEKADAPTLKWIRNRITAIVQGPMGFKDIEAAWDSDEDSDRLKQAQIEDIQIRNGSRSVDESREDDGLDAAGIGPYYATATGPIFFSDIDAGRQAGLQNSQLQPGNQRQLPAPQKQDEEEEVTA